MAESNPTLVNASIPTEAQPNNRFTFDVKVRQGGPDPWGSDGSCTTPTLDITGWKTPIKLLVDGEVRDEAELCLASGNTKTGTLSASLSEGAHTLKVAVYSIRGFAYDLTDPVVEENDSVTQTVTVSREARDPSEPTTGDTVREWLSSLADALGGTTQQVAFGAALAVLLLVIL